jgi:CheY-like chemotaxis protein
MSARNGTEVFLLWIMSEVNSHSTNTRSVVLLVEDDENDFSLLELSCRRAGLGVAIQWVRETSEAIDYLKGTGRYADRARFPFPILVLIDLRLPGESGFDVLKWIRLRPELRGLVVWVYSGSLEAADATKAYSLDANAYIVKPNDLKEWIELTHALSSWLSRSGVQSRML